MMNSRTTAEAIVAFLQSANPGQALSLALAVDKIRGIDPHCGLTDRQLVDIIASNALAMGFPAIMFDLDRVEPARSAQVTRTVPPAREAPRGESDTQELMRAAAFFAHCVRSAVRRTHMTMVLIVAGTASVLVGCQAYGISPGADVAPRAPANCAMVGSTCESPS